MDPDWSIFLIFFVDTGVWKLVKTKGDVPPGRAAHGCVSHGNKILIFGGMTQEGGASDESFIFDTSKFDRSLL